MTHTQFTVLVILMGFLTIVIIYALCEVEKNIIKAIKALESRKP